MNAPAANQTARELRAAFDGAFAERPVPHSTDVEDVLTLTLGTDAYAFLLSQVAGLYADRKLVPLPSTHRELLGIVGLRNALVPIYDLSALLGHPALEAPRWFVLARAKQRVGFACNAPDKMLRVPRGHFAARSRLESESRAHLAGAVRIGSQVHSVIDLSSVLTLIERLGAAHTRSRAR